jgi:hypothetical protein
MPSVRGTVVAYLQPDGMERILHHGADSFNPRGYTRTQALPRCNHSAWPMARAISAMLRPKPLK